jgi:peptidoglycan/xylan/chitin deacetylase (PgdA/CDA1 family)
MVKDAIRWSLYESLAGAIVLRYHSVADLPTDPADRAVRPANFAQQMEVLRSEYQPVALSSISPASGVRRLPRRAVAVTFDDGYADNLHTVLPVLEMTGVPATMFVTTGYVGAEREFWWDRLEAILLEPGRLPGRLRISEDGFTIDSDLGRDAEYGEGDFERNRQWNWRSAEDPTARHELFRQLQGMLAGLPEVRRERVLASMQDWAGVELPIRPPHRPLSREELKRLAESSLVEIGAHSVFHPDLTALSVDERRAEIKGSKQFLEDSLGSEVRSFAYPFGAAAGCAPLVEEAGFELACTTRPGVVFRRRRPFAVPRLHVGDWNADEFQRRIRTLP